MPAEMFQLDRRSLARLQRFQRRMPQAFDHAARFLLNDIARGARETMIEQINRTMTVRSKGFVKSSLRYEQSPKGPLRRLESKAGSIERPRSSGFVEQLEGGTTPTRMATLFARGGGDERQVKRAYRLTSGQTVWTASDFGLGSGRSDPEIIALMQTMDSKHRGELFIIPAQYRGLQRGVYVINGRGQLRMVQSLEAEYAVSRNPWLSDATRRYFAETSIKALWAKQLNRQLERAKR